MQTTTSKAAFLAIALLILSTFAAISHGQAAALITAAGQRQMLSNPGIPILGSEKATITVVEYFDYNCSYCRKLAPAFSALVGKDPGVAVLYKEWPIFGGVSIYAARSALAAQWQGKYLLAHEALISAPRLAEEGQVDSCLQTAGIDMVRLKKDLDDHGLAIDQLLSRNQIEAKALGLRGTPGIVVGRYVVSSVGDLQGLQSAVAHARNEH